MNEEIRDLLIQSTKGHPELLIQSQKLNLEVNELKNSFSLTRPFELWNYNLEETINSLNSYNVGINWSFDETLYASLGATIGYQLFKKTKKLISGKEHIPNNPSQNKMRKLEEKIQNLENKNSELNSDNQILYNTLEDTNNKYKSLQTKNEEKPIEPEIVK